MMIIIWFFLWMIMTMIKVLFVVSRSRTHIRTLLVAFSTSNQSKTTLLVRFQLSSDLSQDWLGFHFVSVMQKWCVHDDLLAYDYYECWLIAMIYITKTFMSHHHDHIAVFFAPFHIPLLLLDLCCCCCCCQNPYSLINRIEWLDWVDAYPSLCTS